MLEMIEECPERKQAFVEDSRVPLKCSTAANPEKAARKVRIAERVRAALDNKTLQDEETIIDVFIRNIVAEVNAAAAWAHVVFTVLPPPFNDVHDVREFEAFMRHFNEASPK
ncbi:hypothetical protein AAVH_40617, partial [Aphelenchoides avenae]